MCYSGKCKLESPDGECKVKGADRYREILSAYGVNACYIGEYPYLSDEERPQESERKSPEELEAIRKELGEKEWVFQ